MTHSQKWSSWALIRYKPQRRSYAARLIAIGPGWFWEKALRFWPWKTSISLSNMARMSWQKSSVTAFLQITFTSHSPNLRVADRDRRWSELSKARTFRRAKSITSMRMEQQQSLMTRLKAKQSAGYLTAYR